MLRKMLKYCSHSQVKSYFPHLRVCDLIYCTLHIPEYECHLERHVDWQTTQHDNFQKNRDGYLYRVLGLV
jgi:hypothetical protein